MPYSDTGKLSPKSTAEAISGNVAVFSSLSNDFLVMT